MSAADEALIIKATRRFAAAEWAGWRKSDIELQLNTFGEVAADVFQFVMTPFAFNQAIRAASAAHPIPAPRGAAGSTRPVFARTGTTPSSPPFTRRSHDR